jgi:histidinol-phosphate aminotransferase
MTQTTFRLSRRGFARILGASAAYTALQPSLLLSTGARSRSLDAVSGNNFVRLSSNENPYGPAPAALKAMTDSFNLAWRYPDEYAELLLADIAQLHTVSTQNIILGDGSGEILKLAAAAFTGPGKRLVVAEPTFEAIVRHARTAKAETTAVPLTSDYRHDLPKMLAQPNAGLVYICNPNNPTASITPKEDIRAYLAKVPSSTAVLIDEAYHHYVEAPEYESAIPLVREYGNLVVARTFSKIYGMAGLRCGYCVGNAELLGPMRQQQTWDSVNIMALVAATASLADKTYVEQGRKRNSDTRKYVFQELEKMSLKPIPSHANFFMVDLGKPTRPIISALRERNVEVGRVFPALPNFMRVTVGTKPQMDAFLSAFREVMRT